mgnify:FL=1
MTIKKIKSAEQRLQEQDLYSPKYRSRREEGIKHYDRNKSKKETKQELENTDERY